MSLLRRNELTLSQTDGHVCSVEIIISSNIKAKVHEYILEGLCINISSIAVTLPSELLVERLVVDNDTQAKTGMSVTVAVQLKACSLGLGTNQPAQQHNIYLHYSIKNTHNIISNERHNDINLTNQSQYSICWPIK